MTMEWQWLPQALFSLVSSGSHVSRAIDTIFRFNDFVSGPPLKLVKNLPHNCDLSPLFIRGNRLICVFKSFVPKNDNLGDHVILLEPKNGVNCTRHDFLTRQEKKEPVDLWSCDSVFWRGNESDSFQFRIAVNWWSVLLADCDPGTPCGRGR